MEIYDMLPPEDGWHGEIRVEKDDKEIIQALLVAIRDRR